MRIRVDVFAATVLELARLDPVAGPAAAGWPCVDSSDWLTGLDRLAAQMCGRDVSDFGDHELIFPDRGAGDWDGPWLVRVPADVVDALALLTSDDIADYARRAELNAAEAARNEALCALCQAALDDRRHVYQWSAA